MRPSTLQRVAPAGINFAYAPRRVMPGAESGTGTLPAWVTSTTALTSAQRAVMRAYWLLIGRVPDRAGLAYWVALLGGGVTVAQAVDAIAANLGSTLAIDTAPAAIIAMVYWAAFGKVPEEDPSGQQYWLGEMMGAAKSAGTVAQEIFDAGSVASGWHGDTCRNRSLLLEAAMRIQISQSYDLDVADSRAILLRVEGAISSYQAALNDLYRLVVDKTPSNPLTWGAVWTTNSFLDECRGHANTATMQHRRLVWYNRAGEMMLAYAVLPLNFAGGTGYPVVILWHGGGWRIGWPAQPYWYAERIASIASCVVVVPSYRQSVDGWQTPAPEHDVADMLALIKSAASNWLKRDAGRVGMMGESSGGHLACLVGSQQDVWRVFALYPPIDLTGTPAVSPDLAAYVGYYASPANRAAASPNLVWTGARATRFELWHGNADTFVPAAQSAAMKAAVGANCTVNYRVGEGHGFSPAVKAEVVSAAQSFFS